MKFYLFYLKYDKSLYACTSVKEYADQFLDERNPDCFKVKVVKLTGEQEKIFLYTNRLLMLNKYPFQTSTEVSDYVEIIATAKEDDNLTEHIEEIEEQIQQINLYFKEYPIKDKYKESIDRLTNIYDGFGHITLDTLSLFVDIHENTFIPKKPVKRNKNSIWQTHLNNLILDNF